MARSDDSSGNGGTLATTTGESNSHQSTAQLVLIHSHEIRRRIVEHLQMLPSGEHSPSKIGKALGESTEDIAYHVKRLFSGGVLESSRIETAISTRFVERFYRLAPAFRTGELPDVTLQGCCSNASAIDAIASRLRQAEGSPYAALSEIATIVRQAGRLVSLPGEDPVGRQAVAA